MITKNNSFRWGYCQCGCDESFDSDYPPNNKSYTGSRPLYIKRFKIGHNRRYISRGENMYRWKKDRNHFKNASDHLFSSVPDHPFCNSRKYVSNSRLVYEHYLKILFDEDIYIPKEYDIYHTDKNVNNNSISNLVPLTKSQLIGISHMVDMSNRFCQMCLSPHTSLRKKNKRPNWYKYYDIGFVCNVCYNHYKKNKDGVRYQYKKIFNLRPTDNTSAPYEYK